MDLDHLLRYASLWHVLAVGLISIPVTLVRSRHARQLSRQVHDEVSRETSLLWNGWRWRLPTGQENLPWPSKFMSRSIMLFSYQLETFVVCLGAYLVTIVIAGLVIG